jgi:hypothetical protein
VLGAGDPLLAIFRRLPLAGRFVPSPPAPPWEALRTYRVRLHAEDKGRCDTTTCFEAVLLGMEP